MTWAARIPTLAGLRYPQASFVLDFANNYYRGSGAQGSSPSALPGYNFTRALAAYAEDTAGNLIQFASGVPRITNKGVLIEESRTNYAQGSQAFDSAAWSGSATGLTPAAGTAPDGTNTAYSWSGGGRLFQDRNAAGNTTYSNAIYAKLLIGSPSATVVVKDNVTDTVRGTSTVSLTSAWQRVFATGTTAGATPGVRYEISVSGGIALIWQADAQSGSFITSTIVTGTSASVTRPADVFYYTYSPGSAGTMAVAFLRAAAGTGTKGLSALNDGTGNNRMDLRDFGSSHNFSSFGTVSGVGQWSLFGGSGSDNTVGVEALSFASNAVTGAMNSSIIATTASASIPSVSRLYIGSVDNGVSQANQYIQRLAIYPFATSDAQLQSISSGNF